MALIMVSIVINLSEVIVSKSFRYNHPKLYKLYQEFIGDIYYEIICVGFFVRLYKRIKMNSLEKTITNPVDYIFLYGRHGLYNLHTFQTKSEILELYNIIRELQPEIICEIGTDNGATLYLWSKTLKHNGLIISIDLPRLYRKSVNRFLKSFFNKSQQANFIRENSHSANSVKILTDMLKGRSIDFLFIDGDHSYEGVREDYHLFSKFVKKNGIIAFHDISVEDNKTGYVCGVKRFWNEIKGDHPNREIIEKGGLGIGILYKSD